MNDKQIDFSRNLIKGRIAEVVFEQMIQDVNPMNAVNLLICHCMGSNII